MHLIYIANDKRACESADECGIDYLMIDLELVGKAHRQSLKDSRISAHTLDDIYKCRDFLKKSKLLVRIDPNGDLREQAKVVCEANVDAIMIPMIRTASQLRRTLAYFEGTITCIPLIETLDALDNINEIIRAASCDYVHIGLNDLHLEANFNFMFSMFNDKRLLKCLSDLKAANVAYGIGGVAPINQQDKLSPKSVISLLNYTGARGVILSRAFNRLHASSSADFARGVKDLRVSMAEEKIDSCGFASICQHIAKVEVEANGYAP